jgi:hypothetical protein
MIIDGDWLCCNLVNGLRVQKQENAQTFLRDSTINWGRCHRGTPPESYIKQTKRGWLRQLWPNILVCMCRETDLSANPSHAPLYCGLCIDFWAPQLRISASTISFFGWCSYFLCIRFLSGIYKWPLGGGAVDCKHSDDCKPNIGPRLKSPPVSFLCTVKMVFVRIHWFIYEFV